MELLQNCIGPTIRICQESLCLPYAGVFDSTLTFVFSHPTSDLSIQNKLNIITPRKIYLVPTVYYTVKQNPACVEISNNTMTTKSSASYLFIFFLLTWNILKNGNFAKYINNIV